MNDSMKLLIKEVAGKHGVALGHDDPILIMHTMNEQLMHENMQKQQMMLNHFKEELEGISLRWGNDTKEKSERILNASLNASKEAMAQILSDSAIKTSLIVQNEIKESLFPIEQTLIRTERVAYINLISSALSLFAVTLI